MMDLTNHIVIVGVEDNFWLILRELRKTLLDLHAFHPVVIFGEKPPGVYGVSRNEDLCNDVYYVRGSPSAHSDLKRLNLRNSFSVQIFAASFISKAHDMKNPEETAKFRPSNAADTELLFLYLHIAHSLPDVVFFSIELCNSYNLTVLNLKVTQHISKLQSHEEAMKRLEEESAAQDSDEGGEEESGVYSRTRQESATHLLHLQNNKKPTHFGMLFF